MGTTETTREQREFVKEFCESNGIGYRETSGKPTGFIYALHDVFVGDFSALDLQRHRIDNVSAKEFIEKLTNN